MSKYHRINWRKSDEQELKRVIRNYNAKITRLEKKNPQAYNKNTLPTFWDSETETYTNKMSVRQMKELINTRQDLKREINALKRFSRRGSEEIVSISTKDDTIYITKWQRNEMTRRASYITRRRKHRLEEIENTEIEYNKQKLGYTRKELGMGKLSIQELQPIQAFNPSTDNYNVKARFRSIMKQSQSDYFNARDYMLRENFIKSIEENYRKGDVTEVINRLRSMDIKEFLNEFNKDPNAFEWNYPPNEEEYQGYLSKLKSTWISDEVDEDIITTSNKGVSTRNYSSNIDSLKTIGQVDNGYIYLYSNGNKIAKFNNSKSALKYIQDNKLKNITFQLGK